MRLLKMGLVARFAAAVWLGVIASACLAPAWASEVKMAASEASSASSAQAEAFLSHAIPAATAANPKYRSSGEDILTQWLTKSVSFRDAEGGGVIVSTRETNDQYRNGALVKPGTHEATFAIDDVTVSLETSDQDVTESGEKAEGVLFRCIGAPCIEAVWDGQKSMSAWTRHLSAGAQVSSTDFPRVPGFAAQAGRKVTRRVHRSRRRVPWRHIWLSRPCSPACASTNRTRVSSAS